MLPKKILEFKSTKKSGTKIKKEQIIDEGTLSKLYYKVYKRGVIHIFNKSETMLFKKDCNLFEDELNKLDLNNLREGEDKKIEGSGDNDDLVFTCKNNDIEISLEIREYSMLSKLKNILKGKKKK